MVEPRENHEDDGGVGGDEDILIKRSERGIRSNTVLVVGVAVWLLGLLIIRSLLVENLW